MRIDKNIPLPPRRNSRPHGYWVDLAEQMVVGDSLFLTTTKEVACLRGVLYRLGYEVVARKEEDGFRVWKGNPYKEDGNGQS